VRRDQFLLDVTGLGGTCVPPRFGLTFLKVDVFDIYTTVGYLCLSRFGVLFRSPLLRVSFGLMCLGLRR